MPSARRQKRIARKNKVSSKPLLKFLVLILIPLVALLLVKFTTKYWNGEDKVSVAVQNGDGSVGVLLFDPALEEETIFTIPAETEVNVSQNLGTIRIKNVWQLGINEGVGGSLLSKTVTKNFFFPVFLWSDETPDSVKFITTKNSNVPIGDRIRILYFTTRVKNLSKNQIDLGKSQFLTKMKLSDGALGYIIPGAISERLTFYFSDDAFSQKVLRVYLVDATGTFGVAENFGKIIEVMGGKIVTVEKVQKEESECTIWGAEKGAIRKISNLFDCKIENKKTDFDVEIKLGSNFSL